MSKQKQNAPKPEETKPAAIAPANVKGFAESQRENAPEETADDLARKALAGTTENNNGEQLSTDTQTQPKPAEASAGGIRDKAGELFNPELHAIKSDGTPSYAKSGVFRRKRGTGSRVALPPSATISPEEQARLAAQQAQAAEEQKRRKAMIAGQGISEIIFKSGYMLGGDEWLPIKNEEKQVDERRDMHTAWAEYCYARGVDDIPPGLLVAFVVSAYALPRFVEGKETQKRVSAFATFIKRGKLWFENWRLTRGNKNAARIANRNDGERKDNASEGDSERAKEK